ncbi:MAG: hypothetical protein CMM00_10445 [Rhodopirellula sp.]|nr:hypothetical protein [Rhodopirellula sp.]
MSLVSRWHASSTPRFVPKHWLGCHVGHGLRGINAGIYVGQVPPGEVIGRLSLVLRWHANGTPRFVPKHWLGCHVGHGYGWGANRFLTDEN